MRTVRSIAALLLCAAAAAPGAAAAAVVAMIDRSDVELNESFTLEVTTDTAIDVEPEMSALDEDFYILSKTEQRNTTIVNGQISRTRTWKYVLMAKQAGDFVIPPITVGNEQSRPLAITIAPVQEVQPGESDVFVMAEVDYPETWVQAQVLYRVKVYRAVPTRQALLYEPDIDGVDVLVEVAAEDRSYDSIIQGKNYEVVERVYALFPQASGELHIGPARFEARVLRDGRITGRKIFKSDAIDVEVQPIPPPPPEHPDAAWFPAKSVQISEEWSREPVGLPAGEPVTRRVSIDAVGQLSTQIPVLEPVEADGIKIYPDKPELSVAAVADGIRATRRDQYAIIAVDPGEVRLPPVELPWWDIREERWRVASLPARTVTVSPSADALPAQHVAAARPALPETEPAAAAPASAAWRNLSVGLACLWLATVLAWWRSRRPQRGSEEPPGDPVSTVRLRNSQLRLARRAAERGDVRETKAALLKWARLQWPEGPPRSIGEIAARVPEAVREELLRLSSHSYGPDRAPWDGAALSRALAVLKLDDAARGRRATQDLPPLMPAA